MGIISKLKSVLGVADGDRGRTRDRGTPVAVERESTEASERAVEDVDVEPSSPATQEDEEEVPESDEGAPDGDEPSAEEVEEGEVEAEEVEVEVEAEEVGEEEAEMEEEEGKEQTEEEGTEAEGTEADEPVGQGEPVDSIKGIGGAYAGRLAEAGVHTVDDLAGADPDELAAATDLGRGRVDNWIERAKARNR